MQNCKNLTPSLISDNAHSPFQLMSSTSSSLSLSRQLFLPFVDMERSKKTSKSESDKRFTLVYHIMKRVELGRFDGSERRKCFDLMDFKTLLHVVPSSQSTPVSVNLLDFHSLLHLSLQSSTKSAIEFELSAFNTLLHWSSPVFASSSQQIKSTRQPSVERPLVADLPESFH